MRLRTLMRVAESRCSISVFDADLAAVRRDKAHHNLEGDALAHARAPEQAKGRAGINAQRQVVQHSPAGEGAGHVFQFHGGRVGSVGGLRLSLHHCGNQKMMLLTRMASARMTSSEE